MSGYCPYEKLTYRPAYGTIDVLGRSGTYVVPVSVKQGRALENDGVPVCWPYASCPAWVADLGLVRPWVAVQRVLTWPSQWS